jgi:hypothetical protein
MPVKPTDQEDEYFARQEFERRRREFDAARNREAEAERERILAVARGRCPKCAAPLVELHLRGIEVDRCSGCQGIWLDFGELDRLTEGESGLVGALRRVFK